MNALVITPVKDSPETTLMTIRAISQAKGDFRHIVYNDFSNRETRKMLEENERVLNYQLVHLEEITRHPSPNYHLILILAQKEALSLQVPLIIIESDVIIRENTISELNTLHRRLQNPGLIGAITTDRKGTYNFPYASVKRTRKGIEMASRSLSFCCTLISLKYLEKYSFSDLSDKKDWFDIFISRQAKRLGFKNYLVKRMEVLHLPHSSRPWKQLKYTHPVKYYLLKWFHGKDKI